MTAISPRIPALARTNQTASTAAQAAAEAQAQVEAPIRPNYVAIYGSSIFAVSMLFLLGVGIPSAMIYGNTTGLGLGAFCAFWGGPSFGVMAGSARLSAWHEKNHQEF